MSDKILIHHLAIPSRDLKESREFYEKLGCDIGRTSETSVIVNFFGSQVVLHLSDDVVDTPTMYPRHFGLVLNSGDGYKELEIVWNGYRGGPWVWKEMFLRNEGMFAEHKSFFLKDPSNNLIELKTYKNDKAIFGILDV